MGKYFLFKNVNSFVIFTLLFLSGCSYNYISYEEDVFINHQYQLLSSYKDIEASKNDLLKTIQQSINSLKTYYDFNINVSALVLDIHSNEIKAKYGDINRISPTYNVFWPITAAVLINEFDIDIHSKFRNIPYTLHSGYRLPSLISLDNEEQYYVGHISFAQGFMDGNNATFFHSLEGKDTYSLYEKFKYLNLSNFPDYYKHFPLEFLIGSNLYASVTEMALLYASFVNGGRLFLDIGSQQYTTVFKESTSNLTLELLINNLYHLSEIWGMFSYIDENTKFLENTAGTLSLNFDDYNNEIAFWFAGIYPISNPSYVVVFNFSYGVEYLNYMQGTTDFVNVVVGAINELPLKSDFNVAYADFLTRLNNINLLTEENFTGFLYVGRDTCPYCLRFNPYLKEVYEMYPSISLYFFDTDYWRSYDNFNNIMAKFGVTTVPTVIYIYGNYAYEIFVPELTMQSDIIYDLMRFFNL